MLVSQRRMSGPSGRQGSLRAVLLELQRQPAAPSSLADGLRQRLLVLSRRLAQVQSLGNGYARVSLSKYVQGILDERTPTV